MAQDSNALAFFLTTPRFMSGVGPLRWVPAHLVMRNDSCVLDRATHSVLCSTEPPGSKIGPLK